MSTHLEQRTNITPFSWESWKDWASLCPTLPRKDFSFMAGFFQNWKISRPFKLFNIGIHLPTPSSAIQRKRVRCIFLLKANCSARGHHNCISCASYHVVIVIVHYICRYAWFPAGPFFWGGRLPPQKNQLPPPPPKKKKILLTLFLITLSPPTLGYSPLLDHTGSPFDLTWYHLQLLPVSCYLDSSEATYVVDLVLPVYLV